MIITRLFGGLGNQMFQYAVGRRLAHSRGTELKLDVTWFRKSDNRTYSLGNFNIKRSFASKSEIAAMAPKGRFGRALAKRWPERWPKYIQEKHFHFDPEILNLPDNVYLKGYWHSEKYFSAIDGIIHREFTVKTPLVGKNKELSERIASTQSVSLHIRQGDYASKRKTKQHHGICPLDYYYKSADYLAHKLSDVHFFIFSDEPGWAQENIRLKHPTIFVGNNEPNDSHEDMRLMSRCNHHIIANSTFSWWAAWLNTKKNKIVIAPQKWFGEKVQASRNMNDLLPKTWVKL